MAVMALPMSRTHLPGRLLRLREGGRERKRIEQERETGTGRQRGRERQREAEGDRERQIEREKKRHRQRQRTETETGLGRADRNRQRRRRRRAGAHSLSIHTPGARPGLQLRLSAVLGEAGTGGESQRDTHTHAHTHTHTRARAHLQRSLQAGPGDSIRPSASGSLRAAPMPPREQKKHSHPSQNPGGGITLSFARLHLMLHGIQPVRAGFGVKTLRAQTAAKRKSSREPPAPAAMGHTSTGTGKNRNHDVNAVLHHETGLSGSPPQSSPC